MIHALSRRILLINILFLLCQQEQNKQLLPKVDIFSSPTIHKATNQNTLKYYPIVLITGDTIPVVGFIPSNIEIDSLAILKKSFHAVYGACHKGGTLSTFQKVLEQTNLYEYQSTKDMTTAYALYDNNRNLIDFNGKTTNYCSIPKGSKVEVFSTIFALFEKNLFVANLLIIDSIRVMK